MDTPEQQVLVATLKASQQRLKEVFDTVVSGMEQRTATGGSASDTEYSQVSWSRLAVQAQGIVFDATRLSQVLRDEANQIKQRNTPLIFSPIGAFAAFLLSSYFLFYQSTLSSIAALQQGTAIVGSGNLAYVLPEARDDEIGELAQSFNRMTADLRAVTASRTDLEQEVAHRKAAEAAVHEFAERLKRSKEDLERFAYVSSHDLQEPLRSIVSFSQLLERRKKGRLDIDADEHISFIVETGNRMQALIRDLLQLSRVSTRGSEPSPTESEAVLDDVLRDLSSFIRTSDAVIESGPLPRVFADPTQLGQVFSNRVSNAIKFSRPGVPPRVRVSAEQDGAWCRFSVTDNGIGISPEYFDRIFVIFQRLHTREEDEGTGIGLALIKRIRRTAWGSTWVESEPGHGSTFFFTLRSADPDPSPREGSGLEGPGREEPSNPLAGVVEPGSPLGRRTGHDDAVHGPFDHGYAAEGEDTPPPDHVEGVAEDFGLT